MSLAVAWEQVETTLPLLVMSGAVGARLTASTFRLTRWLGLVLLAFGLLILLNHSVRVLVDREGVEFYGWSVLVLKLAVTGVGTIAGFCAGRVAGRVSTPFIVGLAGFWFLNWWNCAFPTSFDMNAGCGIPLHRWQDGNFAGYGAGILWAGLVGDVVVGLGIAGASHWIVAALWHRRSNKPLQPTSGAWRRS
jgi:hypothetical protein